MEILIVENIENHYKSLRRRLNYLVTVDFFRISEAKSCMYYCCNCFVFVFRASIFSLFSYFNLTSAYCCFGNPEVTCLSLLNFPPRSMGLDVAEDFIAFGSLTFWYSRTGISLPSNKSSGSSLLVSLTLNLELVKTSDSSKIPLCDILCFLNSSYLLIWLSSSLRPERRLLQSSSDLALERYSWYNDLFLLFWRVIFIFWGNKIII